MRKQNGVTVVEMSMFVVVLAIVAVVAIPQFSVKHKQQLEIKNNDSSARVKSAFALAIAHKGDFPTITEVVEFIDADFASETNDLSGVIFRDSHQRVAINTYSDQDCKVPTTMTQLGVSDVVRCISP